VCKVVKYKEQSGVKSENDVIKIGRKLIQCLSSTFVVMCIYIEIEYRDLVASTTSYLAGHV
jgi:hypothetical protein